MTRSHRLTPIDQPVRRRRAPRPLGLFSTLPDDRTADAMDDAEAAQGLIDDLVALVEAGLLRPVEDIDGIRYAISDPDDLSA